MSEQGQVRRDAPIHKVFLADLLAAIEEKTSWGRVELKTRIMQVYAETLDEVLRVRDEAPHGK